MRHHDSKGWLTRKLCHLLLATLAAVLLLIHAKTGLAWSTAFSGLVILGIILVRGDVALRLVFSKEQLARIFKSSEDGRIPGITYGVCGVIFAFLIGGAEIAAAATMLLGITDCVAGLVGVYLGRHALPYNREKSFEGTVAGLAAGLALMFFWRETRLVGVAMAVTTSIVESLPLRLDDNFTCPASSTLVAVMCKWLVGQ